MDAELAQSLANRLGAHPATPNAALVIELRGVVRELIAERVPDGAEASLALDERLEPVIVAVSRERAIRLKVVGDSPNDWHLTGELLSLGRPDVTVVVRDTAVKGDFGAFIEREWVYELGEGQHLRLNIDSDSTAEDLALESALAAAAGWPTA